MNHHRLFATAALAWIASISSPALTLSYTGNLRTDANVLSCGAGCTLGAGNSDADFAQYAAVAIPLNIPAFAQLTAVTWSYGGGLNAAGNAIAPNGFEPYLSLFDGAGGFLASTFFSGCPVSAQVNSVTGNCYDVELIASPLAPGTYTLVISAYVNQSLAENNGSGTLAGGFTGLGGLGAGLDLHYAFDVELMGLTNPIVPEASTLVLALAPILMLFLVRKQKGNL